ncbi:MAG: hypothetical protein AAB264_03795, partial [Planctomycetota bacterium]
MSIKNGNQLQGFNLPLFHPCHSATDRFFSGLNSMPVPINNTGGTVINRILILKQLIVTNHSVLSKFFCNNLTFRKSRQVCNLTYRKFNMIKEGTMLL